MKIISPFCLMLGDHPKCIIRTLGREHLEKTRQWANDKNLQYWVCRNTYVTQEDQQRWYTSLQNDITRICFAIESLDGAHLENTGLSCIQSEHGHAQFWILLDPSAQGKKLGKAVLDAVVGFAFLHMRLYRLELLVRPDNRGAIRLYSANGFLCEGLLRGHHVVHGQRIDMLMMSRLAPDFVAT